MNAILKVFQFVVCDFHMEQSWIRWFKKKQNIDDPKAAQILLKYFRNIASCRIEVEFLVNTQKMHESEKWKMNGKVQQYIGLHGILIKRNGQRNFSRSLTLLLLKRTMELKVKIDYLITCI